MAMWFASQTVNESVGYLLYIVEVPTSNIIRLQLMSFHLFKDHG